MSAPDTRKMKEQIREMPEGQGAGPDAPETIEPVTGRPGPGGHGPPPRASRADWGRLHEPQWGEKSANDDARVDLAGAASAATWTGLWLVRTPLAAVRALFRRSA